MTDKQPPEWMGKNRKLTPAEVKDFLAEPVGRADRDHRRERRALRDPGLAGMGRRSLLDGRAGPGGVDCAYQDKSERRHFVRAGQRDL